LQIFENLPFIRDSPHQETGYDQNLLLLDIVINKFKICE